MSFFFFFLMIRRPPRSTPLYSSAASDVYKRQIVGTDLRQVERVTGRLTRGRVVGAGALSGMWMGLFVGLIFALFDPNSSTWAVLATVAFGAAFGVVWALLGYAATKGRRDFTSVSQVVATRYEVLVEHKLAEQGRALLARMPGGQPLTA